MDGAAFIRANTTVSSPPLVPEIRLHLAGDLTLFSYRLEQAWIKEGNLPPAWLHPAFWATARPGAQALARYLLDNPDTVRGKRVMDLHAGCGIAAIAALRAGAAHAGAVEIDPLAGNAIYLNAALNQVAPAVLLWDFLEIVLPFPPSPQHPDVILAGDAFAEKPLAERAAPWLEAATDDGMEVLMGASKPNFLPHAGATPVATYEVPVSFGIKRDDLTARVYRWSAARR